MWKKLDWFKYHEISENGDVRITKNINKYKKHKILKQTTTNKGYKRIKLYGKHYMVHRLVAEAYLPKPKKDDMEINHINGIRSDNNFSNLEWCFHKDNIKHSILVLKSKIGGFGGRTKRPVLLDGVIEFNSRNECARHLGVSGCSVSYAIQKGKKIKGHTICWKNNL